MQTRRIGEFETRIEIVNPTPQDLALLGAALSEWRESFAIGGFTSRGLGRAEVSVAGATRLDLSNPDHRRQFLVHRKWSEWPDFETDIQNAITARLGT